MLIPIEHVRKILAVQIPFESYPLLLKFVRVIAAKNKLEAGYYQLHFDFIVEEDSEIIAITVSSDAERKKKFFEEHIII